jgi:diacylglycerol kinase (ATP)
MWVVEELVKAGIDVSQCPIGIIPFGTGNDFSRVLGWGPTAPSSLIGSQLQDLKALTKRWLDSTVLDYDIWEVMVTHNEVLKVSAF